MHHPCVDTFLGHPVSEFPAGTRTAADAAAAIGVEVAQIVKSLVFRRASGAPLLVVASGVNRVDEEKVAALLGEPIGKADAEFVREATGFAIGVPDDEQVLGLLHLGRPRQEQRVPERAPTASFVRYLD